MATQTVLIVIAVIITMLIGLCTEHADATLRVKNQRLRNQRSTTVRTTPTTTELTTPQRPAKKISNRSYLVTWLGLLMLYSVPPPPATQVCGSLMLSKSQRKYCSQNTEMAASFVTAARNAVQQCQIQFKNSRWNCTVVDPLSLFGNLLRHNTAETAFIYAIAAASLTNSITKACSSGETKTCYCDRNAHYDLKSTAAATGNTTDGQGGYVERGCSDNVQHAMLFAQNFLDGRENSGGSAVTRQARTSMNLHNNKVGRQIIAANMRIECRCVGISGSCTSKTCARVLPKFDEMAALLKAKFHQSMKINEKRILTLSQSRTAPAQSIAAGNSKTLATSLVHLHDSYDFCEYNYKMGSLGTRGRLCNISSTGEDNCERLCCRRGYETNHFTKMIDCECVFKFCCTIECKKCEVKITEHRCK